jgi:hypothetical protein
MARAIEQGDKLAIHIPPEHQSAPKETEADKAVRQAAEEIREGKWVPPDAQSALDDVNIALAAGDRTHVKRVAEEATFDDFQQTRESLMLGQHPRVIEALAKLEEEKRTARTPQEYLEKTAMLFEMNAAAKAGEHWEDEGRWQGKDNEEMRQGQVLKPLEFYTRLVRSMGSSMDFTVREYKVSMRQADGSMKHSRVPTVGCGKILLGRHATRIGEQGAYRVPLLAMIPRQLALLDQNPDEPVYLCSLQYPLATEWMVMRFDEFGVPTSAKHLGWRTALLTMIRLGVVTVKQAEKAFPLGTGPASSWYREQLFEWQNHRPGMVN